MVLITESEEDANALLNIVSEWAYRFELRVSLKKTVYMNTKRLNKEIFYRGNRIYRVRQYKYLGRIFQENNSCEGHLER